MQPLWKTVWRFLIILKIDLPSDPATSLLVIYNKATEVMKKRVIWTSVFIAVMATIAKLWKESRWPSTDKRIKKMWSIYTMEYYTGEIPHFCINTE